MQIAMIGRRRMGANTVRRLFHKGPQSVVFDRSTEALQRLDPAFKTLALAKFDGPVSDSGAARWTIKAAIDCAEQWLSAMCFEFSGKVKQECGT